MAWTRGPPTAMRIHRDGHPLAFSLLSSALLLCFRTGRLPLITAGMIDGEVRGLGTMSLTVQ